MVALFSYKNENTIFHKISERKKIIFIFIFSLTIFLVPLKVCFIFFLIIFTLSFFAKFSFYEHLGLWKIIFFYAMLLFFSKLLSLKFDSPHTSGQKFFLSDILFLVRFTTIFYATSIFYKTTSVISIKNSLEDFEKKCLTLFGKKNAKPFFSLTFSLLLTFIPLIFLTWENLKKTWHNRAGKSNLKMITLLFPILISICLKSSLTRIRSLQNRENEAKLHSEN